MYVVKDDVMTHEAIIGLNVLRQGETLINENPIVVKNKKCPKSKEINLIIVLSINLPCKETEINIDPSLIQVNIDPSFKDEVQDLALNYKPHKNKSTNVK